MLRVAIPNKGQLSEPARDMLREAGYTAVATTRELVVQDPDNDVEFFFLRPRDIAVYVGEGKLDLGITGRDMLLDSLQAVADEDAAAAFTPDGEVLLTREDVGRHNAVDKVVGRLLLDRQLPANGLGLFVSGRASFEMVQKAWAAGFSTLLSVSAPTALAVHTARRANLFLAGFVRDFGRVDADQAHAAHAEGRTRAEAARRNLQVLRVVLPVLDHDAGHAPERLGEVHLRPRELAGVDGDEHADRDGDRGGQRDDDRRADDALWSQRALVGVQDGDASDLFEADRQALRNSWSRIAGPDVAGRAQGGRGCQGA